ncbi:type III pantothenate kinase [Aquirufa antheringensis]|uniref:type III pantothenate kinase n=1 Tax=Aquirufa antheringensis TaxID=2516559 RepID=UPI00208F3BC5|nr:type III pantothenate kinase [Aquirufa antheringensis]USQ03481.1 type III pantothenate kinase [Aquirufa antheringensis]
MILCFDFGNTRLKYAFFDGSQLRETGFVADVSLASIAELTSTHTISFIAICSVIEIPDAIIDFLKANFQVRLIAKEDATVRFSAYDASTLGLDRLILAEACLAEFPSQNSLCICLGTCITYNLISSEGEFIGGAISPGLQMRAKAMAEFTDKLPHVSLKPDFTPWGTDTDSNLNAGVMAGTFFEIDGFIKEAESRFTTLNVILTGGDAGYFAEHYVVDSELAWRGFLSIIPKS